MEDYQIKCRLKVSGLIAEFTEYEKSVQRLKFKRTLRKIYTKPTDTHKNKLDSLRRAKTKITDYINTNTDLSKFITLTYSENYTDYKQSLIHLKSFIRKLNTFNLGKLKYIAVMEFQQRGAIHFHLVCNSRFINSTDLAKMWQKGFVKIVGAERIDNLGFYLSKYFTKNDVIPYRKRYFSSKSLKKAIIIYNERAKTFFNSIYQISREIFISNYYNFRLGDVTRIIIKNTLPFSFNYLI